MTYSKTQHEAARQEAANLIAQALKILREANEQAEVAKLCRYCHITDTEDAILGVKHAIEYSLPQPTDAK